MSEHAIAAPDWLTPGQQESWQVALATLPADPANGMDASLLAAWAIADDQYRTAARQQASIDRDNPAPLLTRDKQGRAITSPYLAIMNRAHAQMLRTQKAFGGRPAPVGAPRASGLPDQADDDLDTSPDLLVNKRELAGMLGVSLPTISAWIDRYPDLPVAERGTNGREWKFDAVAVRDFLSAREENEKTQEAERQAAIAQLGMPLEEGGAVEGLTARDRFENIKALRAEDQLRLERGYLVSVPALRQAMTGAVARWNKSLNAELRQAGRDFNLPDAVVRALIDRLGQTQRRLAKDLQLELDFADEARAA